MNLIKEHAKIIEEVLIDAKQRISQIHCWTQNAFARDKDGNEVPHMDERAVSWDVMGTLWVSVTNKLRPKGGPYAPFWEQKMKIADDIEFACEGLLTDHCILLYGKLWSSEVNDECNTQSQGVMDYNNQSSVMAPRSKTHEGILKLYDACIEYIRKEQGKG